MKKMLIVDDLGDFVQAVTKDLKESGIEAIGIVVGRRGLKIADGQGFRTKVDLRRIVEGAAVVFIDHRMPTRGDHFLMQLREAGLSETARIVGTSALPQPYVSTRVNMNVWAIRAMAQEISAVH